MTGSIILNCILKKSTEGSDSVNLGDC